MPRGAGAEVRQLADALDQVQTVAYELATEQAVLRRNATESLVNLDRRNQNPVRRRISFMNKLQREDAVGPRGAEGHGADALRVEFVGPVPLCAAARGAAHPDQCFSGGLIREVVRAEGVVPHFLRMRA
ncbi:hypothetical protein ACFVFQ_16900 [Streptomyces sp. NPDC057743]|uniref:hypothetical protein n=1 Tax=Streptomyces sp. NPDC057743 TaxID=3346236 RepID=UPI0036801FFC